MLYLSLDTEDERLGSQGIAVKRLPLLYCMRCALCWYDFSYKVEDDQRIQILECFEGELMPEWYECVNLDTFPVLGVNLVPVPDNIQTLYDRLNVNLPIAKEDDHAIALATGSFAPPEVGGYPIVDTVNQLCGRAFLQQRLDSPKCVECEQSMYFLAALRNDERQGLKITYDDAQIVFSLCTKCVVVHVQSSA